MMWYCIAFVVGAFLLPLIVDASMTPLLPWLEDTFRSWFNDTTAAAASYV